MSCFVHNPKIYWVYSHWGEKKGENIHTEEENFRELLKKNEKYSGQIKKLEDFFNLFFQ